MIFLSILFGFFVLATITSLHSLSQNHPRESTPTSVIMDVINVLISVIFLVGLWVVIWGGGLH